MIVNVLYTCITFLGSELAKKTIECELDVSYGITDKQKLDIFGAQTLPGGIPIKILYLK